MTSTRGSGDWPMMGFPLGPWRKRFAWLPVDTYDEGVKWLCYVERRRIQKHHHLDGPNLRWWQYRANQS